ncbi:allophanate hydrolase [Thalassotalea insulae]|uniref:Allophanate hydrolase n=1 Tax=Thalassotalea insulae TaxID=2056778 RepID=A0ABQ6GPW6_9GAMM|nr:5-oxoprolinase subunit PxpB [Thalassotalea insulae]GLX78028.1 allophanate hydrolase [Thalassotalea insulae]
MSDNAAAINIFPASENTLLITWPEKICPVQHQQIVNLAQQLNSDFPQYIAETVISYNSLLLYYYFDKISTDSLNQQILELWNSAPKNNDFHPDSNSIIEIPVYYGDEVALDLKDVARESKQTTTAVIELHSQRLYRAYALGFTPGFCYLGSLAKELVLPRKQTPRLAIAKGAVAIAEQQTAVYPNVSPGGWHIIGKTPIEMYQVSNNDFSPTINVGDMVKFIPIERSTFIELGGKL